MIRIPTIKMARKEISAVPRFFLLDAKTVATEVTGKKRLNVSTIIYITITFTLHIYFLISVAVKNLEEMRNSFGKSRKFLFI